MDEMREVQQIVAEASEMDALQERKDLLAVISRALYELGEREVLYKTDLVKVRDLPPRRIYPLVRTTLRKVWKEFPGLAKDEADE